VHQKSGFFSSALRRLSAGSRVSADHSTTSSANTRGARVVYNKTANRPMCPLKELRAMKMQRVAFKVDELDDDILAKEPLYCQIRRAIKYQQALVDQRRKATAASGCAGVVNDAGCVLEDRENIAGLNGFARPRPKTDKKKASATASQPAKKTAAAPPLSAAAAQRQVAATTAASTTAAAAASAAENRRPSVTSISSVNTQTSVGSNATTTSTASSTGRVPEDLGKLYARCCKLREIRPLQYFYNQCVGKTESLDSFCLAPDVGTTVVKQETEIAFVHLQVLADLFACVPVKHVYAGSAALAEDMIKALVASLCHSRALESVSLRGTRITPSGWKIICYLVAMSCSLQELDLTGMHRKHADWSLLVRALEARTHKLRVVLTDSDIGDVDAARIQA
ncbi:uncharacterized protein V1518DRAFT_362024, partial [Limtongia smithiae]|uniref:uncharacterized protein n=1 Tax=Limtongia smithiae TaxID=1125753 RepID=UPI0034D01CA6